MWDCHSCDPGSNPGPGADPHFVSLPQQNNNKIKKEINNRIDRSKNTKVLYLKCNRIVIKNAQ